ncbi:2-amino-4-hydroxy-6-hydroxymethyldihydropteridine diphosphokinase [Chryseobacterium fluminis]|uniref:2-amino-4-hydroxy-6- hydroxymethyldihydropteridine diphosphokinase n=1 Tax=Chryseobacterium fluminis TaxID=2983606 RepID=UPI002B1CD28F|nr:2-amino-4-hydroxy-6-hydroxymethyldihydropteridine diphosphokinase [Chryseobacterium sp. MMS21-Ot14]
MVSTEFFFTITDFSPLIELNTSNIIKKKKNTTHSKIIATIFAKTFLKKLFINQSFSYMSQQIAVLLLGSNLGDPQKNIETALKRIERGENEILKLSEFLISQPVEFVSSNIFCNIATVISTDFSPIQLLDFVKGIEIEMGRLNDSKISGGYTDRIIDIDIVKYNELKFSSERLNIPHKKHLFEREFSRILLTNLFE